DAAVKPSDDHLRNALDRAIMRPQEPCGDRSPWAPGFCEHFHDLGCRPDGEVEGMCRRCLEGEIGGGPDVDPAKTGEKIDIGSPAADAGDRPELNGSLIIVVPVKGVDRQVTVGDGAGEGLEGTRLGARKAELHESRMTPSPDR